VIYQKRDVGREWSYNVEICIASFLTSLVTMRQAGIFSLFVSGALAHFNLRSIVVDGTTQVLSFQSNFL
jgi:hypothetical protein